MSEDDEKPEAAAETRALENRAASPVDAKDREKVG
jgi:hypothetical protein